MQEVARNALRGIRQSMLTDQKGVGCVQIWQTIGKSLETADSIKKKWDFMGFMDDL